MKPSFFTVLLCLVCSLHASFAQAQTPKSPTYNFYFYKKGMVSYSKGEYKEAISDFNIFINDCTEKKMKPFAKAYYWRGMALWFNKSLKLAIIDFEFLHKISEAEIDGAMNAGKCYTALGDYPNALIWFNKAYEREPRNAFIHNEIGMTYSAMNDNAEALIRFRNAFALDTTFAKAYNNAGTAIYFKQDIELPTILDVTAARDYFTQAIKKDSLFGLAWRNRGSVQLFLKEYAAARSDLLRAEQLEPREAQAKIYLGVVAMEQKDYAFAQEKLLAAVELSPYTQSAWEELGNLALLQGRYAAANEYYLSAKAACPRSFKGYQGLMHYHLAAVCAKQKDVKGVVKNLKIAKKLGAFNDRLVYQHFMKNDVFKGMRNDADFSKLSDSFYNLEKTNKFLNQFRWFKMRQGAQKNG
jgi:tetratricopeptide (TPR) repeat protein